MKSENKGFFGRLIEDVEVIKREDPALPDGWLGVLEALLCYPGIHAIWAHRVTHRMGLWGVPLVPRIISQLARWFTGVEIHPGAVLGRRVFIDHGMGVVVGETAEVGDDVVLYHGVTLGGRGNVKGKRHPSIGNGVIIGAGALVLGAVKVGDGARIGAGSVVLDDVPYGVTVVGEPAGIKDGEPRLAVKVAELERRLADMEASMAGIGKNMEVA
jgi:serine O-acetyltransferase